MIRPRSSAELDALQLRSGAFGAPVDTERERKFRSRGWLYNFVFDLPDEVVKGEIVKSDRAVLLFVPDSDPEDRVIEGFQVARDLVINGSFTNTLAINVTACPHCNGSGAAL